ncbi:MAG TPA: adenosine kinase [Afipia sp.]
MRSAFDVVGIGNAIVDVIGKADDHTLHLLGMVKSQMKLIDLEMSSSLGACLYDPVQSAGGAVANTMVGLASLGARSGFIGKVKNDDLGQKFYADLRSNNVEFITKLADNGSPTAHCFVFVTPDANRTMNTFLGASIRLSADDVDPAFIEASHLTLLEGYLLDSLTARGALRKAARIARAAGRKVGLTLSDTLLVHRHKDELWSLIDDYTDILIANETELVALTGAADLNEAIGHIRGRAKFAAVTRAEKGSVIITGGRAMQVPAVPVKNAVDTTGAGDAYAAGVLFGIVTQRSPEECGWLGSLAAAEIVSHMGARPAMPLKEFVIAQVAGTPAVVRHANIARQR